MKSWLLLLVKICCIEIRIEPRVLWWLLLLMWLWLMSLLV